MSAAQHLGHHQRHDGDQRATDGGTQPLRQGQPPQQPLGPGHGLHGKHAVAGRRRAQQGEHQIEPRRYGRERADEEQGRGMDDRPLDQGRGQGSGGHGGQSPHRIAADDQLEGVEGAGQGRIEGGRDRRPCPGADEDALVRTAQAEILADLGEDRRPELAVAGLHADRDARSIRPEGRDQQAQAVGHRHAAAMQGVGFDRVDHLGRPQPSHDHDADSQHQPACRRDDQYAHRIDVDAGAEGESAREVEGQGVDEIDQPVQDRDQGSDQRSEDGADENLRRLVGTQPALQEQDAAGLPEGGNPKLHQAFFLRPNRRKCPHVAPDR